MKIQTIPYNRYEKGLPQNENWILGQESEDTIFVYQAFNDQIANYAIEHQKFGGSAYSFSRMSWIKPNFLWMMYRAGWASKINQERILAIKISKAGFLELLSEGVYSSYQEDKYTDREEWNEALKESEVRIQWDPDHNPKGGKLERRAIQIGIKGTLLHKFNNEWVKEIIDLTGFVKEQKKNLDQGLESFLVVAESIIEVPQSLKEKYSIL